MLGELADIAFAVPGEEGGLPVKMTDKLKALEMLYKYLRLGEEASGEPVTIIDDVPALPAAGAKNCQAGPAAPDTPAGPAVSAGKEAPPSRCD